MRPEEPEEKPEKEASKELGDWLRKLPRLLLVSLFLLGIGFLGGIIAKVEIFKTLFSIGLILIFLIFLWATIEIVRIAPRHLKREQVLESWNVLIQNAQGRAENIFQDTQSLINETKAPDIEMKRQSVVSSIIKGILGGKREFLIVRNHTNRNLKTYQMYINAHDYGNNLHVSWYLVTRIGFWRTLMATILFFIAREPME